MTSTVKPQKMGPHDHVRIAMPIVAAATRTIDTMASVFIFGCETLGSIEPVVLPTVVITGR